MGRRVEQSTAPIVNDVEAYYRWLARRFLHVVDGRGENVCEAVLRERDRIDRTTAPIAERVATFERYLHRRAYWKRPNASPSGGTSIPEA